MLERESRLRPGIYWREKFCNKWLTDYQKAICLCKQKHLACVYTSKLLSVSIFYFRSFLVSGNPALGTYKKVDVFCGGFIEDKTLYTRRPRNIFAVVPKMEFDRSSSNQCYEVTFSVTML